MPWPLVETGPLTGGRARRQRIGAREGASAGVPFETGVPLPDATAGFRSWVGTMSDDRSAAGRDAQRERLARLSEARDRLAAVLELLDDHSHSPAAANVDLAIHHLDQEIGG